AAQAHGHGRRHRRRDRVLRERHGAQHLGPGARGQRGRAGRLGPPAPPRRAGRHGAPACVTVNVRPAIVSVPGRAGPLFAATRNASWPLPVPLAPETIESHGSLATAVHAQPAVAVTPTGELARPLAATERPLAPSANAQPASTTVNV